MVGELSYLGYIVTQGCAEFSPPCHLSYSVSVNCPVGEKPSRSGFHRSITSAPPPTYYEQARSLPEWSTGCQYRLGYMWLASQQHQFINNRIKTCILYSLEQIYFSITDDKSIQIVIFRNPFETNCHSEKCCLGKGCGASQTKVSLKKKGFCKKMSKT